MDRQQHLEMYRESLKDFASTSAVLEELRAVIKYHAKKAGIEIDDNLVPIAIKDRGPLRQDDEEQQPEEPQQVSPARRFVDAGQIEAAEIVLREHGKALPASKIAAAMMAGGYPQKDAKKLRNSLFTGMTRKPSVFENTGGGLWTLRNGHH